MSNKKTNALMVVDKLGQELQIEEFKKALPAHLGTERFLRLAVTILKSPDLAHCTELSLMACVMEAANLGLVFDSVLGHAHIIRYGREATFVVGYPGYIELAQRTGKVNNVETAVIRKGDHFRYQLGTGAFLDHVPPLDESKRGDRIGAWCKVVYVNGLESFDVMNEHQIMEIRARSKSSAWRTDPDQMRRKTVMIRHLKTRGLSPEITRSARKEEYREAGIGRDPREVEAKETKTAELLKTINGGKRVEEPAESESPPDAEKAGLTEADRPKLQADHEMLSTKLGKRRLSSSRIKEMPISLLADAVEVLRQDVAKLTTSSKNPPQSGVDGEDSPYRS